MRTITFHRNKPTEFLLTFRENDRVVKTLVKPMVSNYRSHLRQILNWWGKERHQNVQWNWLLETGEPIRVLCSNDNVMWKYI